MRTLDTATVLSHASATVRKLTSKGNTRFTFTSTSTEGQYVDSRNATAAERRADGSQYVPRTAEQVAGESLRTLRTSAQAFNGSKGFTAPTGKTVAPIGAWVTVDGRTGQVWSEGSTTGTVWVAMVDGDYVETSCAQVTSEPVADVLPLEVPTIDVDAARDLAARAEATGRDGVAFVRQAMGDAAADALEAQDRPAPLEYAQALMASHGPVQGPCELPTWASVEPVERVVTDDVCALCGTPVDALGVDTDGTVWCDSDMRHVVAADAPRGLPVGQAITYAAPTSGMLDQRLPATVIAHGVVGPARVVRTRLQASNGYTWWMRPVDLTPVQECTPDVFAQRMHALRRRHLRLQAWRLATA